MTGVRPIRSETSPENQAPAAAPIIAIEVISPVWNELSSSDGAMPLIAEFMVDMSKPNRKPPITAPTASTAMKAV